MPKYVSIMPEGGDVDDDVHLYPSTSTEADRCCGRDEAHAVGIAYCGHLPNGRPIVVAPKLSTDGSDRDVLDEFVVNAREGRACSTCATLILHEKITDPEWQENFRRRAEAEVTDA